MQARILGSGGWMPIDSRETTCIYVRDGDAFYAAETTAEPGRTAAGHVARLAAEAGVERLVLLHVNPRLRDDEELLRFARPVFPATNVARDGMIL